MIDKNLVAAPGSPDRALLDALDLTRLPRHVAVIMDGNGRWAKQRHLPRVEGHRAGAAAVRDTVETAARLRLDALTLYAFSTENWKRPKAEVSGSASWAAPKVSTGR
jgi:undecaprenyl diphosphate synthase